MSPTTEKVCVVMTYPPHHVVLRLNFWRFKKTCRGFTGLIACLCPYKNNNKEENVVEIMLDRGSSKRTYGVFKFYVKPSRASPLKSFANFTLIYSLSLLNERGDTNLGCSKTR